MERNNNGKNTRKRNAATLMSVAVLLVIAGVTLLLPRETAHTDPPEIKSAVAEDVKLLKEGAELRQTLSYTRCEHVITRRVTAPVELYGKTMEEAQALYPDWRITAFSPAEIVMERRMELFCPDHLVLMPNAEGKLCVFENKYGDALKLHSELATDWAGLPAVIQEELRRGVGFATLAELEQWLESVES